MPTTLRDRALAGARVSAALPHPRATAARADAWLRLRVHYPHPDAAVLSLSGAVDRANTARLVELVHSRLRSELKHVTVDVSPLEFLSVSRAQALAGLTSIARLHHTELAVTGPSRAVRRALRATGLNQQIHPAAPTSTSSVPGPGGHRGPAPAQLVVLRGDEAGTRIPVGGPCTVLGRGRGCDITLADPTAAPHHAEIHHDGRGCYTLRDTGALTGIDLNRRPVRQAELADGDEIRVAKARFTFRRPGWHIPHRKRAARRRPGPPSPATPRTWTTTSLPAKPVITRAGRGSDRERGDDPGR